MLELRLGPTHVALRLALRVPWNPQTKTTQICKIPNSFGSPNCSYCLLGFVCKMGNALKSSNCNFYEEGIGK